MTLAEFEVVLDRYGGRLDAWPADVRGPALDFLETSARAQASLVAMRKVERFLDVSIPAVSDYDPLVARVFRERQAWIGRPAAVRFAWSAAAAVILVAGLFVGHVSRGDPNEDPSAMLALALSPLEATDVD